MLRTGTTKVAKEEFDSAKKPTQIWDVNIHNIIISKLFKRKEQFQVFD